MHYGYTRGYCGPASEKLTLVEIRKKETRKRKAKERAEAKAKKGSRKNLA
jgi:hypothetical protein